MTANQLPIPDVEIDASLKKAVRRAGYMRQGFYFVVLVVAAAGQVSGLMESFELPMALAIPAVAALELGGVVVMANADIRRRLGERAVASRILSAAIAGAAVAFNWLAHTDHLLGGFFAGMSALGYLVWLMHTENQRRDRLRAKGALPPTTPAYEVAGHWLRHPLLTLRARNLAKANPALGLYESLAAARAEVRRERRESAISKVLHRKIRATVDPATADIAVAVYDLDEIAKRLADGADYGGLTGIIAVDLNPYRITGTEPPAEIGTDPGRTGTAERFDDLPEIVVPPAALTAGPADERVAAVRRPTEPRPPAPTEPRVMIRTRVHTFLDGLDTATRDGRTVDDLLDLLIEKGRIDPSERSTAALYVNSWMLDGLGDPRPRYRLPEPVPPPLDKLREQRRFPGADVVPDRTGTGRVEVRAEIRPRTGTADVADAAPGTAEAAVPVPQAPAPADVPVPQPPPAADVPVPAAIGDEEPVSGAGTGAVDEGTIQLYRDRQRERLIQIRAAIPGWRTCAQRDISLNKLVEASKRTAAPFSNKLIAKEVQAVLMHDRDNPFFVDELDPDTITAKE